MIKETLKRMIMGRMLAHFELAVYKTVTDHVINNINLEEKKYSLIVDIIETSRYTDSEVLNMISEVIDTEEDVINKIIMFNKLFYDLGSIYTRMMFVDECRELNKICKSFEGVIYLYSNNKYDYNFIAQAKILIKESKLKDKRLIELLKMDSLLFNTFSSSIVEKAMKDVEAENREEK